jgi:hypothetical protein
MSSNNLMDIISQMTGAPSLMSQETTEKLMTLKFACVREAFKDADDKDAIFILEMTKVYESYFNVTWNGHQISPLVHGLVEGVNDLISDKCNHLLMLACVRKPDVARLWDEGSNRIMNEPKPQQEF